MDPRQNPYAPGAGSPPPELAGRAELIKRAAIALDRVRSGRSARGSIFYGLRGVGKTVLLNHIRLEAEARGITCVRIEVSDERSLPAQLAPALRAALLRLTRGEVPKGNLLRGMRALASFIGALKAKFDDIDASIDVVPEIGLADSGDLGNDLADLFSSLGMAANERDTALVLFIDELHHVREDQFAALIAAFHRAGQEQIPLSMVAAGLPQLIGQGGRLKSYTERLFELTLIDQLTDEDARDALLVPAYKEGITFSADAIEAIFHETRRYPYLLQEWGKHSWNAAHASPISFRDVQQATIEAHAELDASFFRTGFDRLTPGEKRYLRAMSELGPGPHRSGDIAGILKRKVTTVAPVRNSLIAKRIIYSPSHGDTAFTVPLFDGFIKRIMPTL
ncbi:ATP-binding protein [Burkholderia pseudomallei]|uniref:ATP-binding protein n=1 Tax=Burkholderia pseudomallei TaxID=28450 RepID=UPI00052A5DB5|nr:ATP-binding protein [Burkholderia pseudomallei]AIV50052.1 AAA domain protein [Burkholderia pseudomallei MSHR1153]KGS60124.1 AAA domain protein [Burkholderia pseudomallei MSHR5609]